MTRRLAVANEKGGVGKTTVAINVAGALAAEGADVLFVDLDAQGHGTIGLGFEEAYTAAEPSIYDVLVDLDAGVDPSDLVRSHAEFDVIPAHVDMFGAEPELQTAMRGRERLWMALEDMDHDYDYLLVDAPPSLGLLTDNALLACREVLVPALAEATSRHALDLLFEHFETLETSYGVDMRLAGIVINRIEVDGEADRMLEWFRDTYGDRCPLWTVRNRVAIKRAFEHGVSIFEQTETTDMEAAFEEIAATL